MPKGKSTKNKRKKIKDNKPQNMDIEKEEIPKKEENENIELLEIFNNFKIDIEEPNNLNNKNHFEKIKEKNEINIKNNNNIEIKNKNKEKEDINNDKEKIFNETKSYRNNKLINTFKIENDILYDYNKFIIFRGFVYKYIKSATKYYLKNNINKKIFKCADYRKHEKKGKN